MASREDDCRGSGSGEALPGAAQASGCRAHPGADADTRVRSHCVGRPLPVGDVHRGKVFRKHGMIGGYDLSGGKIVPFVFIQT